MKLAETLLKLEDRVQKTIYLEIADCELNKICDDDGEEEEEEENEEQEDDNEEDDNDEEDDNKVK